MREKVTLAGGCFWCTEAIFKRLKGVASVTPGYTGGHKENPTYEEVCSGKTGHAEAIGIEFDPGVISFEKILDVFWKLHDPTSLNRQGSDVGTQYRSVIFYHDEQQRKIVEESKRRVEESGVYKDRIVTEIVPLSHFYKAEGYHQNYYDKNKDVAYCQIIIYPKTQKLYKEFKEEVKRE